MTTPATHQEAMATETNGEKPTSLPSANGAATLPKRKLVVIAKLNEEELYEFLRMIRSNKSTARKDISHLIADFCDLARILQVEEHYHWSQRGTLHQRYFQLNETEWKSLIDRLVIALEPGLELYDAKRMSNKAANNDETPYHHTLVKTIPQDIFKLYQRAWEILVSQSLVHEELRWGLYLLPTCGACGDSVFL